MKRDGVSVTIVLAAVFAASILIVFIFGCFTDKKGTESFYVNSEEEIKIPVVELIATPARTHIGEARAVLSSVNSSKFYSTALVTVSITYISPLYISPFPSVCVCVCVIDGYRKNITMKL